MMMAEYVRPRSEIIEHLRNQQNALLESCKSFDRGNQWEAARLANAIYTLVHDHGRIVSIMTQLGVRGSARFVSSGLGINPKNLLASTPLVKININSGTQQASYLPLLEDSPHTPRLTQFPTWWGKELIFKTGPSHELTRKRLVFSFRNEEGGGHVSPLLTDQTYVKFLKEPQFVAAFGNNPPKGIEGAAAATMRQIAWEMLETLNSLGEIT
jgi:hypothetical protein